MPRHSSRTQTVRARARRTDSRPALHRRHEAHTMAHTPSPARLGMEQQADGPLLTPRCPEATFRPGGGKAPSRSQHHPDICARKPGLGHSAWHSAPRLRTTRLPPVLCGRRLPPPPSRAAASRAGGGGQGLGRRHHGPLTGAHPCSARAGRKGQRKWVGKSGPPRAGPRDARAFTGQGLRTRKRVHRCRTGRGRAVTVSQEKNS